MRDNDFRETVVITGAFSYTGKYATRILQKRGYKVRTLTFHTKVNGDAGETVQAFPYNFERPDKLTDSLRGASTLINTYWVRFPRGTVTFETAVRNSKTVIEAAKAAGVRRIVQVSIANPSLESPLGYYKGKAEVEEAIKSSGMSYGIVRPTVIFGLEDILINNIAWFLRNLPVFGIPGDGLYGVRPIYVEDMAELLVEQAEKKENTVLNAVGPETFAFKDLVGCIGKKIGERRRLVEVPCLAAHFFTQAMGWFVGDVVLTWEEYKGLMAGLLAPTGPETGATALSEWLEENGEGLGRKYASEVGRHFRSCDASA